MTNIPNPVFLYRLIHINNLPLYLQRQNLHSPNHTPNDGLQYHTIHSSGVQERRAKYTAPCGPGGTLHDYVPFYFGHRSPMLYMLKNGHVDGYNQGQKPLIYLISTIDEIQKAGCQWIFSNGQGNTTHLTQWFEDLERLDQVDWDAVNTKQWKIEDDPDLKRRKQAEFLVYQMCPWSCIIGIGVSRPQTEMQVNQILAQFTDVHRPQVKIWSEPYY